MLRNDEPTTGYLSLEETEITALQQHAQRTVANTRTDTCHWYLTNLHSLVSQLMVQVLTADKPLDLAKDLKDEELAFLEKSLKELSLVRCLFISPQQARCHHIISVSAVHKSVWFVLIVTSSIRKRIPLLSRQSTDATLRYRMP